MKIKPKKCHFFQCTIVFLRHVLSAKGISGKPQEGREGKKLVGVNQPKRITIIFGVGLLLLPFDTKILCNS